MKTLTSSALLCAAILCGSVTFAPAQARSAAEVEADLGRQPRETNWLFQPIGAPLKPDQMVRGRCDMGKAYMHGGPGHERSSPHYREKHRYRSRNFKGYQEKPGCWIAPTAGWRHP